MESAAKQRVVCIHEDREGYLVGAMLAIASLRRYEPLVSIAVSSPAAPESFNSWVSAQPRTLSACFPTVNSSGWNIKPSLLLQLLGDYDEVIWLDSDIITFRPWLKKVDELDDSVFVATQETYWGQRQGGAFRTRAWGLEVGRLLSSTVNSGVLRVTRRHIPLLLAWQQMLANPVYLEAQAKAWYERPLHMVGDQEVLTGLLGSFAFADIPVHLLRRGSMIAQCFGPAGFTPIERIRVLATGSKSLSLIHAMGPKPWRRGDTPPSLRGAGSVTSRLRKYYEYMALDLSPYTTAARSYRMILGTDDRWLSPHSLPGKLMFSIGFNNPALIGLPLSLFDHSVRAFRSIFKIGRFSTDIDSGPLF